MSRHSTQEVIDNVQVALKNVKGSLEFHQKVVGQIARMRSDLRERQAALKKLIKSRTSPEKISRAAMAVSGMQAQLSMGVISKKKVPELRRSLTFHTRQLKKLQRQLVVEKKAKKKTKPSAKAPKLVPGWAYEFTISAGPGAEWRSSPDANWSPVVVSASVSRGARFIGFRRIEGVAVMAFQGSDGLLYAQSPQRK
jgi:hypothetical protein